MQNHVLTLWYGTRYRDFHRAFHLLIWLGPCSTLLPQHRRFHYICASERHRQGVTLTAIVLLACLSVIIRVAILIFPSIERSIPLKLGASETKTTDDQMQCEQSNSICQFLKTATKRPWQWLNIAWKASNEKRPSRDFKRFPRGWISVPYQKWRSAFLHAIQVSICGVVLCTVFQLLCKDVIILALNTLKWCKTVKKLNCVWYRDRLVSLYLKGRRYSGVIS
jgi:hypothetical protein